MPALPASALVLLLEEGAPAGPNMFVIMAGTLAIFWFVAIMPERKARKKKQAMIEALQKNDRVLTSAGMFATVAALGETDVVLKFDDGPTRVKVLRSAIASVLDKDEEAGS
jgi:preprotein translocase subunit YajC